jgi:hypothetical protein
MEQQPEIREVFRKHWTAFLVFLIEFGFDALKGLAIFTVFLLFAWVIGIARAYGVGSEEHFKAYELAHFWLNYALYVSMGLAFLLRVLKSLWGELK